MTKKRTVYLDMDGVLADFATAAFRLCGVPAAMIHYIDETWPIGRDVLDIIGIKEKQFWAKVQDASASWWADLKPYRWKDELLALASSIGDVLILSSPARSGASSEGKTRWISKNAPNLIREFVFTPKKHKARLARPGDILIDDTDKTCQAWHSAGGHAILFPRPWNSHPDWRDPMAAVRSTLHTMGITA